MVKIYEYVNLVKQEHILVDEVQLEFKNGFKIQFVSFTDGDVHAEWTLSQLKGWNHENLPLKYIEAMIDYLGSIENWTPHLELNPFDNDGSMNLTTKFHMDMSDEIQKRLGK